jgi:large-conductance mechanosensitive channel
MAVKEQLIIRIAIGTILGLALTTFGKSLYTDLFKPIFNQKIFTTIDKEIKHDFIVNIFGTKINYGDLIENFVIFAVTISLCYTLLYYLEINHFLK